VETGYFGSAPRGAGASNVTGHGGLGATAEGRPLSGLTRSVPENRLARSASAGGTRVRFGSGDLGNVAKRRPSSSSASFMPIGDPGHILAGRGDPERIADPWRDMVRPQSASSKASSRALSRPGSACYYNALSPMTTCQNVKTEKVQEEIKESEALFRGNRDRKATIKDPFALDREEQKIVDFDEELHVTNTMLEELGKKVRLDGVADLKSRREVERELKRQEELRKRAEHERRLREQAKEAQNPKKRVLLRVEQQREFGGDEIMQNVPMVLHEVRGDDGNDKIPIVNVKMLQARSIGLNIGNPSFKSVYELAGHQQRRGAWEQKAFGRENERMQDHIRQNRAPGGESVRCRTRQSLMVKVSESERRNEQRQLSALKKRRQIQEDKAMMQLQGMRSEWTLEDGLRCSADTAKALREIHEVAAEYAHRCSMAQVHMPRKSVRPYVLMKLEDDEDLDSPGRNSQGKDGRRNTKEGLEGEQVRRIGMHWTVVRGAFYLIWLLFMVRRKHDAIDCVRTYLYQVATVKILNDTCRKLNSRVRKLQNVARAFIARKRAWTEQTSRSWLHYEDKYLETNLKDVKGPAPEPEKEEKRERERERPPLDSPKESPKRPSTPANDWWKILRIPAENRNAALGRWYISRLRSKVQMQSGWLGTVETAHSENKDLRQFFTLCGLDFSDQPLEVQVEEKPEKKQRKRNKGFLEVGEQEMLELIAIEALELRDVEPFQNHPFNKNLPRDTVRPSSGSSTGRRPRQSVANISRIRTSISNAVGDGNRDNLKHQRKKEMRPADVDELFRRFTPRLRQIQAIPREGNDYDDDLDFCHSPHHESVALTI